VSTSIDVRTVILLRTTTRREGLVRVPTAMEGVSCVERIQRPLCSRDPRGRTRSGEVIEEFPGVTAAEICWLSPRAEGGVGCTCLN
jgi:hypothetical protein